MAVENETADQVVKMVLQGSEKRDYLYNLRKEVQIMPRQRFYGDWELICKDFMESGLSRSAYSKKKGIPMTSFCKKLDEYKYKKSSTEFIPVKVVDKTKAELTITIGMAKHFAYPLIHWGVQDT